MSVGLTRPKVVGEIPPCLMENLSRRYDGMYPFTPFRELTSNRRKSVYPIIETLATQAGKLVTRDVRVLVHKEVVAPGRSQRPGAASWHRDGKNAYIMSTEAPTEFLEGQLVPGVCDWWDELDDPGSVDYKNLADSFDPDVHEQDVGLRIWRPEPHEFIQQGYRHIHRSPTMGDFPVDRTFMAVVFPIEA